MLVPFDEGKGGPITIFLKAMLRQYDLHADGALQVSEWGVIPGVKPARLLSLVINHGDDHGLDPDAAIRR